MLVNLKGKVAVVTAGGGILCGMFCKQLAACGARVAVLDIEDAKAETIAEEIREAGGEAISVHCDALDMDSIRKAEEKIYETYGQYHILINGAGGAPASACTTRETADAEALEAPIEAENTLFNMSSEVVTKVLDLNAMSVFNVTKVFAKRMANVPGACVVNMSSMSAYIPLTKQPAYSAGKAAVSSMTKWLATYLAPVGIRVNAIAPGFFSTTINQHLLYKADGTYSERSGKIIRKTPMGRFGNPEELLGVLMFLCDESASGFVTGVVIPVDGGFQAYCGV